MAIWTGKSSWRLEFALDGLVTDCRFLGNPAWVSGGSHVKDMDLQTHEQ